MKAVNLIPADARRERPGTLSVGTVGPGHFVVSLLAIVVVLVLLRVLTDNTINNRKATLSALQTEVVQQQAEANRLSVYTQFVQSAQQREEAVRSIAEGRFAWKRSFDQLAHVIPATTSLETLTASTSGGTAASTSTTTAGGAVPQFGLTGCAHTRDQNGIATLIRHLRQITGVTTVGFQTSTRTAGCGDQFSLNLLFQPLPGTAAAVTPATTPGSATSTVTTPAGATPTTTTAATTPAVTTTTGAAG